MPVRPATGLQETLDDRALGPQGYFYERMTRFELAAATLEGSYTSSCVSSAWEIGGVPNA